MTKLNWRTVFPGVGMDKGGGGEGNDKIGDGTQGHHPGVHIEEKSGM